MNDKYITKYDSLDNLEWLVGSRTSLGVADQKWVGYKFVKPTIPILIMAGHADSQGGLGGGTIGEAVGIKGQKPMDISITDELYWNLKLIDLVVKIGQKSGLQISSYVPSTRNIVDPNDPRTNWSVGAHHAFKGGYPIEIHFDAYGEEGLGSGLIPALSEELNTIDESLAKKFGRFPKFFRGGLGAPRRQIRILEIGKLEGNLEKNLREIQTREKTLKLIANYIIQAIEEGVSKSMTLSPLPQMGDIFLPAMYL